MRQRRILMPNATIAGTHLCNAYEVARMNDMIAAGQLEVSEPTMVPWQALPAAHQSMWDNTHAGANYVVNHALPRAGFARVTNFSRNGEQNDDRYDKKKKRRFAVAPRADHRVVWPAKWRS